MRQRPPRSGTYRTYSTRTAENNEQTNNGNAPIFFQGPSRLQTQANANATNEEATPEVTQEELAFIEERGYLDDTHRHNIEDRRRSTNRTRDRRHRRQRVRTLRRQEQEESQIRTITALTVRNITRDILRGIHVGISSERANIYRSLSDRNIERSRNVNYGRTGRATSTTGRNVN